MKCLVSKRNISEISSDADFAREMSKHVIDNVVFDYLLLSDPYQGIIGMSPQEVLHMMGSGMYKYLLFDIKDVVGERNKNAKRKGLMNKFFVDIKQSLAKTLSATLAEHQTENDVFDVTSLTGRRRYMW
jgi:hypothetical protein